MFSKETATTSSGGEIVGFSVFLVFITYISSIQGNTTSVTGENKVFLHVVKKDSKNCTIVVNEKTLNRVELVVFIPAGDKIRNIQVLYQLCEQRALMLAFLLRKRISVSWQDKK